MVGPALLLVFGTSFLVGLSGAMMPGPLLAVNISQAARRGFWVGPRLVLGHGILESIMVVALARGLREIFQMNLVAGGIGLLGGGFLLWMGLNILRQRKQPFLSQGTNPGSPDTGGLVWQGALVSLSNPYWFVWWVTVGASYTLWALEGGILGVSSFYLGHILSDLGWYSLVSLIIATGRRTISDGVYRAVLTVCSLALFALGAYFMASGINLLSHAG